MSDIEYQEIIDGRRLNEKVKPLTPGASGELQGETAALVECLLSMGKIRRQTQQRQARAAAHPIAHIFDTLDNK